MSLGPALNVDPEVLYVAPDGDVSFFEDKFWDCPPYDAT
jgi:hypothetical protein